MRIVIVGATELGATLARRLIAEDTDVVLIDKDRAALEALAEDLDCGMINADGTLPSTLREAGGDTPNVLVALTHSDEDNILCAIVGRSVGFKRVIPQIAAVELASICEELELGDFITPDETIATSLIASIEDGSSPMRASPLCGDLALSSYEAKNAFVGRSPDDIDIAPDAELIAITRGEEDCFACEIKEIEAGDRLVFLSKTRSLRETIAKLSKDDEAEK